MTDKYKNKYRISPTRLQNWDYGWNAPYFITICTHNRKNYFGEIRNGKMELSNLGVLENVFWYEIKNHSKNIEFDAFIVMPNHIHGILILNDSHHDRCDHDDDCDDHNVQARHALPLSESLKKTIGQNRFQNQGKNTISSLIGSYKSAVTKHANRLELNFKWQSSFHDHIIRDTKSFERISNYITNNPSKWNEDKFHTNNE